MIHKKQRIIRYDGTGKDVYLFVGKCGRIGDGLHYIAMDGQLLVES